MVNTYSGWQGRGLSFVNYTAREINTKVIYAGIPNARPSACLKSMYASLPDSEKSKLLRSNTEEDPTYLFDFLWRKSVDQARGFGIRFHIYNIPVIKGFEATRSMMLKDAQAFVIVISPRWRDLAANRALIDQLLLLVGVDRFEEVPVVLQYTYRNEIDDVLQAADLDLLINPRKRPSVIANSDSQEGLFKSIELIAAELFASGQIREAYRRPYVFISHNKVDRLAALELAGYLTNWGADVWLDQWTLKPGDSITAAIESGLKEADIFILIWSARASKSRWVDAELKSFLHRAIEREELKIIPIRVDATRLPTLVADRLGFRISEEQNLYSIACRIIESNLGAPAGILNNEEGG